MLRSTKLSTVETSHLEVLTQETIPMRSLKIVPTKPAREALPQPDSLGGEAPHLERALVPLSIVLVLVITRICQQVPR